MTDPAEGEQSAPESAPFRMLRAGSGSIGRAVRKSARAAAAAGDGSESVRWAIAQRLADALDSALAIGDDLPAILKLSQELDRHLPAKPKPRAVTGGAPSDGRSTLDAAYEQLCAAELGDTPES